MPWHNLKGEQHPQTYGRTGKGKATCPEKVASEKDIEILEKVWLGSL